MKYWLVDLAQDGFYAENLKNPQSYRIRYRTYPDV